MYRVFSGSVLAFFLIFLLVSVPLGCNNSSSALEEIQDFRMDTYLRILAPPLQARQIGEIRGELIRLEGLFDRFSPDSDLSRVSKMAGQWVNVDETTVELITEAQELAQRTEGAFDITIGPLADLWQIRTVVEEKTDKPWTPPTPETIAQKKKLVGYEGLEIQPGTRQVRLQEAGMGLDMGGIAKGYAVDRLAELFGSWQIPNALIDFGGDFYALGQHPEGRPWRLAILHPRQPEKVIASIPVKNQAVTTSGDYQRYRLYEGERFSHLLSPVTGYPARELVSVTIVADSGVVADALATAVFVLGEEKGKELLESWPGVEGVIIDQQLNIWVSSGLKDQINLSSGSK